MNRHKRQHQILLTALKTFARDGYSDITISDLVTEAKVSRGTFYLYFQSKKDVFDCLIDSFLGNFLKIISRCKFDSRHESFVFDQENKHILCQDLAHCLSEYHLMAPLIWGSQKTLEPQHQSKISGYEQECYRVLEHNLHQGKQSPLGKSFDVSVVAHIFMGAFKEITQALCLDSEAWEVEEKLLSLFDLVQGAVILKEPAQTSAPLFDHQNNSVYLDPLVPDQDYQ